jgi:ureidoglycolate lyase
MPAEGGRVVNAGTAVRFDDLATLDLHAEGGRPLVSLFRANPPPRPLRATMLERHPLSTQLFMPLSGKPYLVLVAHGKDAPDPASARVFMATQRQGINFRRGTWHHPLLVLDENVEFLVLGRAQRWPGDDLEETAFAGGTIVHIDVPS